LSSSSHGGDGDSARLVVDDAPPAPRQRPRVLVTNDDGFASPGLQLLARELARAHDVVVVAPDTDRSGSGTGIGRFDPDEGVALTPFELPGVEAYRIAGPPGLAVLAGALGAFGRQPDLVVSGVNAGMNTGHSVIHSGTVGGALTARTLGSRGLAVSLAASEPWRWETAVAVAASIVDWLLARPAGAHVLNVNVPARAIGELQGVTWAALDDFGYFRVAKPSPSDARLSFGVSAKDAGRNPDSDTARCLAGWVTLTALSSVGAERVPWLAAEEICRLPRA
jgi:5'-nucleotidase